MSAELIGILSVGVGLGGMGLAGWRALDRRLGAVEAHVAGIDRRLAHVEGLLEGLGLAGRTQSLPAGD